MSLLKFRDMTTYYLPREWTAITNLQTQSPLRKILLVEVSNYMPPNLNFQHAVSVVVVNKNKK